MTTSSSSTKTTSSSSNMTTSTSNNMTTSTSNTTKYKFKIRNTPPKQEKVKWRKTVETKTMDSHLQKCEAAWKTRQSRKKLPKGWSYDKIVSACPLREFKRKGGNVVGFVKQWNAKFDFQVCRQRLYDWGL